MRGYSPDPFNFFYRVYKELDSKLHLLCFLFHDTWSINHVENEIGFCVWFPTMDANDEYFTQSFLLTITQSAFFYFTVENFICSLYDKSMKSEKTKLLPSFLMGSLLSHKVKNRKSAVIYRPRQGCIWYPVETRCVELLGLGWKFFTLVKILLIFTHISRNNHFVNMALVTYLRRTSRHESLQGIQNSLSGIELQWAGKIPINSIPGLSHEYI